MTLYEALQEVARLTTELDYAKQRIEELERTMSDRDMEQQELNERRD